MSNLLVKISMDPNGKKVVELGVNIQMQGKFRNGIVEHLGYRKMSRKFIAGVCKALVKQIEPQLLAAIKQEQHYQDHPEDIPRPPEGVKPPPLNHALLGREPIGAAPALPPPADTEESADDGQPTKKEDTEDASD